MLESKLCTGTSKTKKMQIWLDEVALFWMSQWTACSPAWRILYHVTASCKGPIYNTVWGILAILQFTIKISVGSERCARPEQGQTTTSGTASPALFEQWVGCETGPTFYSPYPRRLESLTICRCNYKQRQHFLLSYLKTLSVGPTGVRAHDLPHGSPMLNQLSQPVGGNITTVISIPNKGAPMIFVIWMM